MADAAIESVTSKPIPHRRLRVYFLVLFLVFIAYLNRMALSVAGPAVAKEFHLSPIAMGYLFSAFFWMYTLSVVPAGMVLDRFGGRRVITFCLAFWSLMSLCTGVATGMVGLFLSRFGLGVGESATLPTAGRTVREWSPLRERGFATTLSICGSHLGPGVGAIFLGWLVTRFGWRTGFLVSGGVGFVLLAAWLLWYHRPDEAKWLDESERSMILAERGPNATKVATGNPLTGLGMLLKSQTMWGLAMAHGTGIYTQFLFLTWLPTYLLHSRGGSMVAIGAYIAIPYCVAAAATVGFGWISDLLLTPEAVANGRRRNICVILKFGSAAVMLLPWATSLWQILAILSVSMSASSAGVTLHYTLVTDLLLEPEHSARAYSLLNLGGNLGGLCAPIVTGYVVAYMGGYNVAFILAGLLLLIGAVLLITMTRKTIGKAVQPVSATVEQATR